MTLKEMATLITTELGVFDDTSVDLTKLFLNKEYVTLWDKYPWTDTRTMVTRIVQPGTGVVEYPTNIDRAITVRARDISTGQGFDPSDPATPSEPTAPEQYRSDARFLDPVTATFLVESDPAIFEIGGYAKYYQDYLDPNTHKKFLRVYPVPVGQTELVIVGKAKCPGLPMDSSVSIIRNIDPALIAYAYFDMLQRQRQYGKAEVKRKEAQELEAVAWNLEQQQANQPRLNKATTVAGNSLIEMTDAVCMLCGQWTPEFRLVAREFLRRNYQTMYDTYLWPESLVAVRVRYFNEQVIMPSIIDKVLGVRGTSNTRLFPAEVGLLMDISPSVFEEIGEPLTYTTLTPVAVRSLPSTTTRLMLASTSPVDTGMVAIRGEVLSSGVELEEQVKLQGTTPVGTSFSYDIPLTVAKDITIGNLTINMADGTSLGVVRSFERERKYQRLWLLPILKHDPEPIIYILVMAKRTITPLVSDQDTPIITGAQQVLIASAAGDAFRRLGDHNMATALLQKAEGCMAVLKAKNTDQAANAPRFVPQIEPRAYTLGAAGLL